MSVRYDSFTLERRLAARPETVWPVWTDPALKRDWFTAPDSAAWTTEDFASDMLGAGAEHGVFRHHGGPLDGTHEYRGRALDAAPPHRIVYAYTMAWNGTVHSASLVTVEIAARAGGSTLTCSERINFLDSDEPKESRIGGTEPLLDRLMTVAERAEAHA